MFESFPMTVRDQVGTALTITAEGGKADIMKPLKGLGLGIMEIAIRYRIAAWCVAAVVAIDRSDAKITVRRVKLSACIVHAEWDRA